MELETIIRDLYQEKKRLEEIIVKLERLQRKGIVYQRAPRLRGTAFTTSEAREAVSRRMKAYWAERKSQENTASGPAQIAQ